MQTDPQLTISFVKHLTDDQINQLTHPTLQDQTQHCLDQVVKFAKMLKTPETADRSQPILILQMGFNWGRWVELTNADGQAEWQWLEKCIKTEDYDTIISRFCHCVDVAI
jgi:hypothetical protein